MFTSSMSEPLPIPTTAETADVATDAGVGGRTFHILTKPSREPVAIR